MEESKQIVLFIFLMAVLFVGFLIFAVWLMRWQFNKADRLLKNWARENNYRILEKQNANFGDGPAGTRQSSSQVKYQIVVIDSKDQRKSGLVTVGSKNLGTLSDEIVVGWDD